MSPAPARTTLEEIVAAGRDLLERGGTDAVTMLAVAERVGVKAPSLYKRVRDRNHLLAAIGSSTIDDLGRALEPLRRPSDPAEGLRSMAAAFRAFAHAHPRSYALLFESLPPDARPPDEQNARVSAPVVELAGQLVGENRALEAARLVTAFAHGFISMELAGTFRLGGDLDHAYRYGIGVIVDALGRG